MTYYGRPYYASVMAPKIVVSLRLDLDILGWLDGYAARRGVDRTAVVTAALKAVRSGNLDFAVQRRPTAFPATEESADPSVPRVCLAPEGP